MRTYEEMCRQFARESALWNCLYWAHRFEEMRNEGYCEETIKAFENVPREQAVRYAIRGLHL